MTRTTAELLTAGNDMREENPVLWAVVRGKGHIARIGIYAGQGEKTTRRLLEMMLKSGLLVRGENSDVFYLNRNYEGYAGFMEIRRFYEAIELAWIKAYDIDVKRADVTTKVYEKVRTEIAASKPKTTRNGRDMFDETLTMKQAQLVALAADVAGESTFRPIELSRAQGYSQAGYTKNTLLALANKGMVKEVKPYPTTWQLTSKGLEVAKEAQERNLPSLRVKEEEMEVDNL